jgi:hypothetical protein
MLTIAYSGFYCTPLSTYAQVAKKKSREHVHPVYSVQLSSDFLVESNVFAVKIAVKYTNFKAHHTATQRIGYV